MKKSVTFILGLFMVFLPFASVAKALGNKEFEIASQKFCDDILKTAKETIEDPAWEGLQENDKYYTKIATDIARRSGLKPYICYITFYNAKNRWAIEIRQDNLVFICDYYQILYELSEKHLPTPLRAWHLMNFEEYIEAQKIDEGKIFETMFSFNVSPNKI